MSNIIQNMLRPDRQRGGPPLWKVVELAQHLGTTSQTLGNCLRADPAAPKPVKAQCYENNYRHQYDKAAVVKWWNGRNAK